MSAFGGGGGIAEEAVAVHSVGRALAVRLRFLVESGRLLLMFFVPGLLRLRSVSEAGVLAELNRVVEKLDRSAPSAVAGCDRGTTP